MLDAPGRASILSTSTQAAVQQSVIGGSGQYKYSKEDYFHVITTGIAIAVVAEVILSIIMPRR